MRCREGVAEVSRGVVGCRGGVVGCREGVAEVSRGVAEVSWCVDRPSTQINALTCLTILTRLSVHRRAARRALVSAQPLEVSELLIFKEFQTMRIKL